MQSQAPTVMVTGAGAGAGRNIAERFGREGWRVGLISRSAERLDATRRAIEDKGGEALVFPADVSDCDAVFAARDRLLETWGRLDAWVNAAMVTVVGPVWKIDAKEFRRVMEVTWLGYVHGTLAALEPMRKANAGAIVQVGSALAYRAIPLQSAYCAAKFAIRGFSDSLRTELEHEHSAVRVTMLQMPGMNTPQFDWARNKLSHKYQPVGEVFDPDVAGAAAVRAVKHGSRELWVGGSAVQAISGQMIAPAALDRYMAKAGWNGQIANATNEPHADNLFEPPPGDPGVRGRFGAKARRRALIINPDRARVGVAATVAAVGGAAAVAGLISRLRSRD
ncbi:MAG TPA: SDR family oxidoreductase [Caulobacteraceae bacterium]|jgi:short-subunit dehydrogenase|nr:SDR family oxidoreductase [Caulobacteraceae bacterium]